MPSVELEKARSRELAVEHNVVFELKRGNPHKEHRLTSQLSFTDF